MNFPVTRSAMSIYKCLISWCDCMFLFFVPISYTLTLLNLINALTMNVNKYINRFIVSNEMETANKLF